MHNLVSMTVLCVALLASGCTDAAMSQIYAVGSKHLVELYSGGVKVREWVSTGKVLTEDGSDGYYFRDSKTDQLVRVSGDLVITPISE